MNQSRISLNGVFPPIPTPFDPEGAVAYDRLTENLERWNECDLAGYVVLGSNGEVSYLSVEEKVRVWETARGAIPPSRLMIAGAGCESTRQTISLSRRAADAGADGVLILTPHYYGGQMTPDALTHHFEAVADQSPVPVIIYNMPRFTHLDLDASTIVRLARHSNIVGLKDSSGNVGKLAQIVGAMQSDFQVLAGSASFFFPGLAVGAAGGVMALANVAPQQMINLHRLFEDGEWKLAAAVQQRLVPVNTAVTARFGVPGLKAALDLMGYYGGPVRSPLQPLSPADIQTLKGIMIKGDVL